MQKALFVSCLSLVSCFVLVSCGKDTLQPNVHYGPASATGTLIKADLSLTRRGTHLLIVKGERTYFVESRDVNLSEFEGREVGIGGTLEPNTTPSDLPVLVAKSIKASLGDEGLHIWEIPVLNLSIKAPKPWIGKIEKKVATFSLQGEALPILTVKLLSGSTLPQGSSFYVQNRRATRTKPSAGGVQEVYILEKDSVISLQFDPTEQKTLKTLDETRVLEAEFEQLLSDLKFISDSKFTGTKTGSGSGVPCGGGAGILCAPGFYCAIMDSANQIGECRKR